MPHATLHPMKIIITRIEGVVRGMSVTLDGSAFLDD